MPATKKNKLKWIKGLMLLSQAILLLFTIQWLISQYNEQQAQLKKNLTELFADVQQNISDSLIYTHLADTAQVNKAIAVYADAPDDPPKKRIKFSSEAMRRLL